MPPEPKEYMAWAVSVTPPLASSSGLSQLWTRVWTCDSNVATATAPPALSSRPNTIQLVRSVATYSITTNRPKNSSEVPRSVSKTRIIRLSAQMTRMGPRSRPRGR